MSFFQSFSQLRSLIKNIDLGAISKLSQKVDLNQLMGVVSKMSEEDLGKMLKFMQSGSGKKKAPPVVNGDFYELSATLTGEDREIQLRVRDFMETQIRPIANEYWNKAHFPMHIIPLMAKLDICGLTYKGYGCAGRSALLEGFIAMEMARVDSSISTFSAFTAGWHGLHLFVRL
jgi:glutaryl-CoA dehydrogenase